MAAGRYPRRPGAPGVMVPLLRFLVVVLLAYLAVCLLVALLQRRMIYFPVAALDGDPRGRGLAFEELAPTTADGVRLHGWWLPREDARGVLLFLHGNAGNVSHRLDSARAFLDMGLSVALVDYRGYGRSAGSPSEEGLYRDARAAYRHLVEERGVDPRRLVLYGESLGGAVALDLARDHAVGAVITEGTPASLVELGAELYPWLPVRLLQRERYESLSKVGQLSAPLLVIHSPQDEIVPFAHARRLLDASPADKLFLETEGGHNDGGFLRRAVWRERVAEFVRRALPAD